MVFERVGVLMGGLSAEREVSLASGGAVADGLERSGFDVVRIDATRELDRQLREADVEAVFIALHGRWGEDGTVQGMLEVLGIPYTGSSPLASALAMDKALSRALFVSSGLPMAPGITVESPDDPRAAGQIAPPLVVKPSNEGSSVGVSIVRDESALRPALELALSTSKRAIIESYVQGIEVNVAMIDGAVLGSVEIEPHREFYDYSAKYDDGGSTHHIPPRIPDARITEVEQVATEAYAALGCWGAARVDLIVPTD
ncbi:MAG: D-alanine--D-alanine ligase, partial [Deltaproteobacteria bacterium]|nr:D-alanine--D-alanine ligase [Deltaproteobacteria bacterium]